MRHRATFVVTMVATLVVTATGTGAASTSAARKATKVPVSLQEFDVTLRPATLKPAKVSFSIKNTGGVDHEFVVVRLSSPTAPLPTLADGSLDEASAAASDELGEIPTLAPKKSKTLTVTLTPGTYQLYCNLVDHQPDGRVLSHYKLGMHANLKVR